MNWTYNQSSNTWLCGTKEKGCGVYENKHKWAGTVVFGDKLHFFDGFETKEEMMMVCERELERLNND